jgi:hypothetical protein
MREAISWVITTVLAVFCIYLYDAGRDCRADYASALRVIGSEQTSNFIGIQRIAVQKWVERNGNPKEVVLVGRRPITIKFGQQRCVALVLERGALGTQPVYCFDNKDRLVSSYEQQ